jgi:hypothetical protein
MKHFEKPWAMTTGVRWQPCTVHLQAVCCFFYGAAGSSSSLAPSYTPNLAQAAVMFMGMTFCLPISLWVEARKEKRRKRETAANGGSISEPLLPANGSATGQSIMPLVGWRPLRGMQCTCMVALNLSRINTSVLFSPPHWYMTATPRPP